MRFGDFPLVFRLGSGRAKKLSFKAEVKQKSADAKARDKFGS
jgi:hypothetical protein